jgi:carbon storage regulator
VSAPVAVDLPALDLPAGLVGLGIAAPREVAVHREEVYRELQRANQSAASPSPAALESFGRLAATSRARWTARHRGAVVPVGRAGATAAAAR